MELTGLSGLSGIGEALNDRRSIADNFDTFLQILTTQLQNQNPLEPMDTNEFTNQLVQFSSVEQSIKTNENLETLLALQLANTATAAVSYIGKTVTAQGKSAVLADGNANWTYSAQSAISGATVTIADADGNIVFSEDAALTGTKGSYVWDGRTNSGDIAPDGQYSITIAGRDAQGGDVAVSTGISGVVDNVDLSGAEPVLMMGNVGIKLSAVKSIGQGG